MPTSLDGYDEFLALRREVLNEIGKVDMSWGCKPYEGTFELLFSYPNFFDEDGTPKDEPDAVIITLHCYVLGPNRHYDWRGKTLKEAVAKCRQEVETWKAESY